MESYRKLLLANKAWAKDISELRPEFFQRLAKEQKPEFLWIGCSDSRVPAEEITGAQPGEIFVHRNVANLFLHADFNVLSVLQYAIEALKVKHIIVCGHYGCGGIQAALSPKCYNLLNKWLYYIKDSYVRNKAELEALPKEALLDRMVEINVIEQVKNLSKTSIIQKAWQDEQRPTLHGWVFNLKNGLLKDLILAGPDSPIEPVHRFDFSL